MNAILRVYQGDIAFIGDEVECNRLALLLNKWDNVYTVVQTLFDDGLSYRNHCLSLNIQNNSAPCNDLENLFERTKKQGKTVKTIRNKIDYFRHEFRKLIRKHFDVLTKHEEPLQDGEYYWWDESLSNWWLNYYFNTHDKELGAPEIPLRLLSEGAVEMVKNALVMERRNRGNAEIPKFTVKVSESKVRLSTHEDCFVKFEWDELANAAEMMGLFEVNGWTARDGKHFDWTKEPRKKLNKMFPHARIETMNTPTNLYQQSNKWFYIYFHWKPEYFSWAQVRKAEAAVKKLIVPKLGKFRPEDRPKQYQVVTLKF